MRLLGMWSDEAVRCVDGGGLRGMPKQKVTCPVKARPWLKARKDPNHAENLQPRGMRPTNRCERRKSGLSETLLRCDVFED